MTKKRAPHYRTKTPAEGTATVLFSALRALAITLVSACLLLFACAAVLLSLTDPVYAVDYASWVCLGLSSFAGGVAAFFCMREDARTVALLSGGMFICVLLILAFATDGINSPLFMFLGYAVSLALHYLGACAAIKMFGKKKRKNRAYQL